MITTKKSTLKRIIVIVIITVFTLTAVSLAVTKLVYDSIFSRYDGGIQASGYSEKHSYGELTGYLFDSEGETLVVLAPGFHAQAGDYLTQIEYLKDNGFGVFAFDPLGHGLSGGSSVGFSQELADLEQTLKYIEKNSGFGYNETVLLGHSRGGYAVCCALASDYDIAAVVSVGGINSAMEGVIGLSAGYVGPLAYGNYAGLWAYQVSLFGTDTVNLSARECIQNSTVPTLIVHGSDDNTVPIDKYSIMSYRNTLTRDGVEYIEVGGGHTDILFNEDVMSDIVGFINSNSGEK